MSIKEQSQVEEEVEYNEEDLDEDEHLYQFTINFDPVVAAATECIEHDLNISSDDEDHNKNKSKKNKLRKPNMVESDLTSEIVELECTEPEPTVQEEIQNDNVVQEHEDELMNYAKVSIYKQCCLNVLICNYIITYHIYHLHIYKIYIHIINLYV